MIAWSAQDLLAGFGYRCIADLEVELLSQASRVCCSAPKLEKPNRVNLPYALKEKAVSEFTLIAIINWISSYLCVDTCAHSVTYECIWLHEFCFPVTCDSSSEFSSDKSGFSETSTFLIVACLRKFWIFCDLATLPGWFSFDFSK